MRLFGKNGKDDVDFFESDDRLILFDEEKRTSDIVRITDITDTAVMCAGRYSVPKADCEVTTSPEGRVYFYRAPSKVIEEVERLAKLEQSIVLQQLTNYKEPVKENPNLDMKFWGLAALLFVAIIVAAF